MSVFNNSTILNQDISARGKHEDSNNTDYGYCIVRLKQVCDSLR